jgi:Ca2+-binding RTX toxin-like protein
LPATDSIEKIDGKSGLNVIAGTDVNNLLDFTGTVLLGIHHIDGKAGDDDIRGSQGNDILIGDLGNDRLQGGAGNDLYLFGLGRGKDRVENYAPAATDNDVLWMYDVNYDKLWFAQSGWDLQINVIGTNDQVKIANWYFNEALQLDAIYSSDRVLLRNQVDQLVNAMAGFAMPTGAGAVIPQAVYNELQPTLSVAWQQAA